MRMVKRHVKRGAHILEVGAGPPNKFSDFLAAEGGRIVGLDIDPEVRSNKALSEAIVYDGSVFPLSDDAFDAVVMNYVIEHLEHPQKTFTEINRVLKAGGVLLFRTPNLWHPLAVASRAASGRIQRLLSKRLRGMAAETPEPYPLYHRANSPRTLRRLLSECGFVEDEFRLIEKEPSYGMSSRILFLIMLCYERLVNSSPCFASFRVNILGAFHKNGNPQAASKP